MRTDLYHISPTVNNESIERRGVDPTYSLGKLQTMYYVDEKRLFWAMLHISRRHQCPIDQLTVHVLPLYRKDMIKTGLDGVYRSNLPLFPASREPATNFVTKDPFEAALNAFDR